MLVRKIYWKLWTIEHDGGGDGGVIFNLNGVGQVHLIKKVTFEKDLNNT